MSAPAARARSEPVITTHRTPGSASVSSRTWVSSSISWPFSAFSASGRLSRIRVTASCRSTIRVWGLIADAPRDQAAALRPRDGIAKRAQAGRHAVRADQVAYADHHDRSAATLQAGVQHLGPAGVALGDQAAEEARRGVADRRKGLAVAHLDVPVDPSLHQRLDLVALLDQLGPGLAQGGDLPG